jgi:hypothetical protein
MEMLIPSILGFTFITVLILDARAKRREYIRKQNG